MTAGHQHQTAKPTFGDVARKISITLGSGWAFLAACAVVLVWALIGPALGFSDAWQLVINTGTTIVTFLIHYRAPIFAIHPRVVCDLCAVRVSSFPLYAMGVLCGAIRVPTLACPAGNQTIGLVLRSV
jgi:hypothetical protein